MCLLWLEVWTQFESMSTTTYTICDRYTFCVLLDGGNEGRIMDLQLARLRRDAGYSSRAKFAAAFGATERQIKAWETGERKLSLERACDVADFLGCSLDDLAGRDYRQNSDKPSTLPLEEAKLIMNWRSLDDRGRETVESVMDVQLATGDPVPEEKNEA